MEQRPRRRWISVVCFSRPVALEFGDEDLQFFFRQVQQIALGQIGAATLEFGIFGEKPSAHYRVVDRRVNKAESWESINLDLAAVARKLWEHSRLTEAPGDRRISTLDASAPNAPPGRR
jgi:hypothetical protein